MGSRTGTRYRTKLINLLLWQILIPSRKISPPSYLSSLIITMITLSSLIVRYSVYNLFLQGSNNFFSFFFSFFYFSFSMGNGYIDPPRLDEEEESITATLVIGWESNPLPSSREQGNFVEKKISFLTVAQRNPSNRSGIDHLHVRVSQFQTFA